MGLSTNRHIESLNLVLKNPSVRYYFKVLDKAPTKGGLDRLLTVSYFFLLYPSRRSHAAEFSQLLHILNTRS